MNGELRKALVNPESLKLSWLLKNVRLRSSINLGSPVLNALCPKGLKVLDIGAVHGSVKTLPRGEGALPTG